MILLFNVLILTSNFLPQPDANGININIISQDLMKKGCNVVCVSYKNKNLPRHEIINGIEIYRIKPSLYSRILEYENKKELNIIISKIILTFKFIRKILLLFLLLNFPNFDILQSYKIYNLVNRILKTKHYDLILGVYKPFSNISALIKIKHQNPEILCGVYYLDLINSIQKPAYMPLIIYKWLCKKADYKVFSIMDFSLVAKTGEILHNDKKFKFIKSKIYYIDFPTFQVYNDINYNTRCKDNNSNEIINMIYAGTLDKQYRNPKYLLDILYEITKYGVIINLNIFGKGNCNDILMLYNGSSRFIVNSVGYKESYIIREEMLKANFVINISNEFNNVVPSKIFELFSTGKPIINIVANKDDISSVYFNKYPSVFNVYNKSKIEDQVLKLYDYIMNEKNKNYSVDTIASSFKENTPEYTTMIIMSHLLEKGRID